VYKAQCTLCDHFYLGNTQQLLKARTNQHIYDTYRLVNKGHSSDSFAKHWATHFPSSGSIKATPMMVRQMLRVETVWQGNPISCIKSFRKRACRLCMKERLLILKTSRGKDAQKLINSNHEIYGACRHNTKFHRYSKLTTSTDDVQLGQKELPANHELLSSASQDPASLFESDELLDSNFDLDLPSGTGGAYCYAC
jgi:hypothetical protein